MAGRNTEYKMAIRIAGEIDKTFPKSIQMSRAELRAIAKEAAQAEKEFSRTSKQMGKGLFDASALKETKGFFTAIEKAGVKAFKAIGKASATAVGAVGAFSIKTGMDYEEQMSTVKAISKASESDFKIMQEEAKRIGSTTAATAKEAGQAMEYEAMAGWKADQIVDATAAIVDLKQSSKDLDLATTSDIVTDAITAFKMEAKDAKHMTDVLASTSTNANTDVAKMGESFKYAGAIAGSQEYSVEDTALTLGLMANASVKGSMAGTAERNWIKRMVKPTKESEKAMKDLGLSLKDSKGNDKSLLQITEDTRKAFGKIKDKNDRTKYASMLAGAAGSTGLLAIVNAKEKDFQSLKNAIYDCDGAAKELANTKLDNLEGDVTLFTSAMQGAGVDIYEEIKEPLRDLVQGATEWVGDFSEGFKTSFPTIVREAKQAGEAISDFAEPFLEIGGWMLDNPEVIAGTIAGIGSAIVAYKVVEGVTALKIAVGGLTKASLPILGLTAAVAVIGGIATAVNVAAKEAKEASLDRHFGDVTLSMEEVQRTAKEIVGTKKLERVGELFQSMESVEKVAKAMESAKKEFSTIEWRLYAGLKITKSDREAFEKSVKEYVDQSQNLISEKGYEVNVAAKVLFGNSKEGKNLIKDNNKFFSNLDKEATSLSSKINDKLETAMKDGLTVDLEKEINELLGQLADLTNRIQEAEAETSWQMLKDKFSGQELDADSFKNVIKETQENADELKKGAEEAKQSMLIPLNDKKNQGTISDEEYQKEYAAIDKAYRERVNEADSRVSEFMYNTIMDAYGTDLASGNMETSDLEALKELTDMAKETGTVASGGDLGQLIHAVDAIEMRTMDEGITWDNILGMDALAIEFDGGTDVLEESWDKTAELAQQYINDNPMDFKEYLEKPAKEASDSACEDIQRNIVTKLGAGITASVPIALKGDYSIAFGPPTPIEWQDIKSALSVKDLKPTPYALGGIATEPTLLVAEAGSSEAVIPLDGSARSVNLWEQTGRLLGAEREGKKVKSFSELLSELSALPSVGGNRASQGGSDGTVHITYTQNITIQGNADQDVVQRAASMGYGEFVRLAKKWEKDKKRSSF